MRWADRIGVVCAIVVTVCCALRGPRVIEWITTDDAVALSCVSSGCPESVKLAKIRDVEGVSRDVGFSKPGEEESPMGRGWHRCGDECNWCSDDGTVSTSAYCGPMP